MLSAHSLRALSTLFLCSLALLAPPRASAADPGAWDDFYTAAHADDWSVFDYSDNGTYLPQWFETDDGGDIFMFHNGDAGLWFFTDTTHQAGGGAFIGDYLAADIQAINTDIFIDSLADFDFVDCLIYASDGPAGAGYYYSFPFFDTDFTGDGWWSLRFGFDETWFYLDGSGDFVATDVTPEMLQSIEEIGFRFFLEIGTTSDRYSAIDNVQLEPKVIAPSVATAHDDSSFHLTFTPPVANRCTIQKLDTTVQPAEWKDVAGESSITGTDPYTFTTPLDGGTGLFRVTSGPSYDPINP